MRDLYVGIDLSFNGTGILILDKYNNIVNQELIKTKRDESNIYDIEQRMIIISEKIKNFLIPLKDEIKIIFLEGISFGSKGSSSEQLASLNYYIRIFLFVNNFNYYAIPPTTIKKYITGVGNCKKNLMLKEVYKKYEVDFSDDNLCDAYSLARMASDGFEIKGNSSKIRKNKL